MRCESKPNKQILAVVALLQIRQKRFFFLILHIVIFDIIFLQTQYNGNHRTSVHQLNSIQLKKQPHNDRVSPV